MLPSNPVCGICGFLTSRDWGREKRSAVLRAMVHRLAHRGPDDRGFHLEGPLGLGHARLSIIDLQGGRQPLFNETGEISLICNGEIYNFRALRRELERKGHCFQTESDNEVILHLWEQEGTALVQRLRGMFAFVLYDRRREILLAARDRFGQKPFYYAWNHGELVWASEIKGLLEWPLLAHSLDWQAVEQFFFYQFVPPPRTLFQQIRQLPPGHILQWQGGQLRMQRYWDLAWERDGQVSSDHHLQQIEEQIVDAVRSHLVSDVPVGIFLSGGIDSSLIAAIAQNSASDRLSSFSIGFREARYDESAAAYEVSQLLGTKHRVFQFEPGDMTEWITRVARVFDLPLADRAAIPLLFLSQEASRYVKVVLTGDGGDELFAGYDKYRRAFTGFKALEWALRLCSNAFAPHNLAACRPDRFGLRRLRARCAYAGLPEQQGPYLKQFWEGWDRWALYRPEVRERIAGPFESTDQLVEGRQPDTTLNRMLQLDMAAYLPADLLTKTDGCTMAFGLEARAPLLDHYLGESAARLPPSLKASRDETKIALRRIAAKWLPGSVTERPKRGFGVPLPQWFRGELYPWLRRQILEEAVTTPAYFQASAVAKTLEEHRAGQRNHASKLYSLLMFELWHREFGPSIS